MKASPDFNPLIERPPVGKARPDSDPTYGRTSGPQGSQAPDLPELEQLANWMDSVFRIPGLGVRFGFDALLGLVPGFGDTAAAAISVFILHAAARRGVSRLTMTRMSLNLAIDYIVGAIPVLGDAFDVYWKANQRNVALLRRHALANPSTERRLRAADWLFLGGIVAVLVSILVGSLTIAWFMISGLASWMAR